MSINLFRDLGYDETSPEVKNARAAAETYEQVVETLVAARKENGMKQREVAKRMGTSQSAVSEFESAASDVRFSTLLRYAQAVSCEVNIEIVQPGIESMPTEADDTWGKLAVSSGWRFGDQVVTGPAQWSPADTVDGLFAGLNDLSYRTFHVQRERAR